MRSIGAALAISILTVFVATTQLGGVSIAEGVRFTVVQALLAWLLLVPLHYAWWRVLGLLG